MGSHRAHRMEGFRGSRARNLPRRASGLRLTRDRDVAELRIPPSNRLEALKADRIGQYSIRVNDQWRLCFRFDAGNAFDVEIVDYH